MHIIFKFIFSASYIYIYAERFDVTIYKIYKKLNKTSLPEKKKRVQKQRRALFSSSVHGASIPSFHVAGYSRIPSALAAGAPPPPPTLPLHLKARPPPNTRRTSATTRAAAPPKKILVLAPVGRVHARTGG